MHLCSASSSSVNLGNCSPSQTSLSLIARNTDFKYHGDEESPPPEHTHQPEPWRRVSLSTPTEATSGILPQRPGHGRSRSLSSLSLRRHKDGSGTGTQDQRLIRGHRHSFSSLSLRRQKDNHDTMANRIYINPSLKRHNSLQTIFHRTATIVTKPVRHLLCRGESELDSPDSEIAILLRSQNSHFDETDLNPFGTPRQTRTFLSAKPTPPPPTNRTKTWHDELSKLVADQLERDKVLEKESIETWRSCGEDEPWNERFIW